MSEIDVEAIRERWANVSPWPWQREHGGTSLSGWPIADMGGGIDDSPHWVLSAPCAASDASSHEAADAEAIAHAPSDVAALLAEVERLQCALTAARSVQCPEDEWMSAAIACNRLARGGKSMITKHSMIVERSGNPEAPVRLLVRAIEVREGEILTPEELDTGTRVVASVDMTKVTAWFLGNSLIQESTKVK